MTELLSMEDRDQAVPPCDSLAEAVVLNYLLWRPERMVDYDVGSLLVFPEHRAIWRCMQQSYRLGEPWTRFYVRWLNAAEGVARGLSAVLDGVHEAEHDFHLARMRQDPDSPAARATTFDIDWWMARLRKVTAARQLVEHAQEIAARAWRGDVDGAVGAVHRADGVVPREVIRVHVPMSRVAPRADFSDLDV